MIKKYGILLLCLLAPQAKSHEFLTQILVTSDVLEVSPDYEYSIIETFHLTEFELDRSLHRKRVRQEIKRHASSRQQNNTSEHTEQTEQTGQVFCDEWDIVFSTCGIFDDFTKARSMAIDICNGVADSAPATFVDGLIPQFIGPATFTNGTGAAANHHDDYEFSHGLSFHCVEVISNLPTE